MSLNERAGFTKLAIAALGGNSEASSWVQTEGRTVAQVMEKIIGKAVSLAVIHKESKGKTYANIAAISSLSSQLRKLVTETVNPLVLVMDANDVTDDQFKLIPKFIQDKLASRLNLGESNAVNSTAKSHF